METKFWSSSVGKFVRTRPPVDEVVARCTTVSSVAWLALAPPASRLQEEEVTGGVLVQFQWNWKFVRTREASR